MLSMRGHRNMKIKLKDYKIGELSDFYGISTDTFRLYDKKGLLISCKNDINNYRIYTRDDFVFTDNIMRLRNLGIPLSDIKKIVSEYTLEEIAEYGLRTIHSRESEMKVVYKKYLKLKDFNRKIEQFSQNMGKITVERSPTFIIKKITGSFEETNKAFDKFGLDTIITLCFYYPQRYFDDDMMIYMNNPKLRGELFEYSFCQEDNENAKKILLGMMILIYLNQGCAYISL